jgi:two-component system response regulator YesN
MKIIITDDEEHVREGIELAVDWDKFGIKERLMAEDGLQAMELIRAHQPAILFCDMSMPNMDGTRLLQALREEGWDTQVIVVSGYEDFNYTRAALLANGVDYILKPFKKSDLEQAVSRAVVAYQANQTKARDSFESGHRVRLANSFLDERMLAGLLNGEMPHNEGIRNLLYRIGLPLQGLRASLILPCNMNRLVDQRFAGDSALFVFAINNIVQEILRPYGAHYICRLDEYQWVLLTAQTGSERISNEYEWIIAKLERAWLDTLGLKILKGVCEKEAHHEELTSVISEARASLLKCELLGEADHVREKTVADVPRLIDKELLLMEAVKQGNKAYLSEVVKSFAESLKIRGVLRLEELQMCTIEANLLLKRAACQSMADKESVNWFVPLWINELNEWEMMVTHRWWTIIEEGSNDKLASRGIQGLANYMHHHYRETLTLAMLSEKFHFSPQYLAKKFKEHYHMTVMTYLTKLRIEKAESLLANSDMPISQLAHSLGYEDDNYFGKVFKKQTGLSPIQFRRNRLARK